MSSFQVVCGFEEIKILNVHLWEEIDIENEEEEVDLLQLISIGHQQLLLDETPTGGGIGGKKPNSSLNNVTSKEVVKGNL